MSTRQQSLLPSSVTASAGLKLYFSLCIAASMLLPAVGAGVNAPIVLVLLSFPVLVQLPRPEPLELGDRLVCLSYVLTVGIGLLVGGANTYFFHDGLTLAVLVPIFYSIGRRASAVGMLRAAMLTMVVLVSIAAVVAVLETRRRSYFVADPTFFVTPDRDGRFAPAGSFRSRSFSTLLFCCGIHRRQK